LLDDSRQLAARLKEAGVRCELKVYEGLNHGFIRYGRWVSAARRAVGDCAVALSKALSS
jgi:acetyl esterase/lipase